MMERERERENESEIKKSVLLRLNYGAVMAAWASKGIDPWADGITPHFNDLHELTGKRRRCSGGTKWAGKEARGSEVVLQEDSVRGKEIECRQETKNQRPICQKGFILTNEKICI